LRSQINPVFAVKKRTPLLLAQQMFKKCLGLRCHLADPPNPLKKGASDFKVPLFKEDLGGSKIPSTANSIFQTSAQEAELIRLKRLIKVLQN
jgi:hypothetical protein